MDSDILENASELIVKSIMAQDLTSYADLLGHDVTLNVAYDNSTLPLPAVTGPTDRKKDGGEDGVAKAPGEGTGEANPADSGNGSSMPPGIVSSSCTSYVGPKAFGEATFKIFTWLQQGKFILEPRVVMEPRRPRKDAAGNPVAASPKTVAPQESMGGGSPRKNSTSASQSNNAVSWKLLPAVNPADRQARLQNCSRLTVLWGRVHLQIRDDVYFEDGVISVVDRSLIAPEDPNLPQYLSDRATFLGESQTKVSTRSNHPPVLDFTFTEVHELVDCLRTKPTNGRLHNFRGVEQAAVTKAEKNAALYQLANMGRQGSKVLIKAKNKKGEEEAYEFADDRASKVIKAEREQSDDLIAKLAEQLQCKYEAEAFRLTNNPEIRDVTPVVPVLRSLVANSFLTLAWIDLSNNAISTLPNDLPTLPLTTLYLHGNKIASWSEIDRVVVQLPFLASFTLFGNPIAQQPNYKNELLIKLLTSPSRSAPLKQLDFVALSTQDLVVGAMHEALTKKQKGGNGQPTVMMKMAKESISMRSPRKISTPQRRGGSSPRSTLSSVSPRR